MENKTKRILIVEDDQFLREFYQELLTAEGYSVDIAADGEIGLAKLEEGGFDLVLLDIMLPKKDGVNILKEIRLKNPQKPNGAIVILTNLGQESLIRQCFDLGAVGYLIKSALQPDQVIDEIKSYLSRSTS